MAKPKLNVSIGQKFNRLTVISDPYRTKTNRAVDCLCDCGKKTSAFVSQIFHGTKKSCGCYKAKTSMIQGKRNATHGHSRGGERTPTYLSWSSMRLRCENKNATGYQNYGGRGVKVCTRWLGDEGFLNFLADMGERPKGTSLDRIDNKGDYNPNNCKWSTVEEQLQNRRCAVIIEHNGETKTAAAWAREVGTHRNNILRRLKRGLPIDEVLRP